MLGWPEAQYVIDQLKDSSGLGGGEIMFKVGNVGSTYNSNTISIPDDGPLSNYKFTTVKVIALTGKGTNSYVVKDAKHTQNVTINKVGQIIDLEPQKLLYWFKHETDNSITLEITMKKI